MSTDGTLHALVPVSGPAALLVERFSADPRGWLPPAWREGWVTLTAPPRSRVPARCSFGPAATADGTVSRTVLLDPHGGRAAAPGFAGTLELRADEAGATLLLRARYRYVHPQAGPDVGQRLAHEAAVRWLSRLGGALEQSATLAEPAQPRSRAAHPAAARRLGRLRVVPG